MTRYPTLTAAVVAFATLAAPAVPTAMAAIITTYDVDGDTYYRRDAKGTNYGGSDGLQTKTSSSSNDRNALLRFDIGAQANTLDTASLSLFVNFSSTRTYAIYGIPDLTTYELFDENAVNFNNLDDGVDQIADFSGNSLNETSLTALGTFTTATTDQNTAVLFSSAALKTFINDDTNGTISFVISRVTANSAVDGFRSKEATPDTDGDFSQLILTTSSAPIPEPASLALVALGGVLMLRRR